MPSERTKQRAAKDKREGKAPSTQAGEFVREEIEHVREGKHGARSTRQAIAIGLSKARRVGVKLGAPKKGTTSAATRRKASRDLERGQGGQSGQSGRTGAAKRTSAKRSRATKAALKREGHAAGSRESLARQAHTAASRRPKRARSASARREAQTRRARGQRSSHASA